MDRESASSDSREAAVSDSRSQRTRQRPRSAGSVRARPLHASALRPTAKPGFQYDVGGESDALLTVRRRERTFRRTLVATDMGAAAFAVFAAINFSTNDRLRPGYLLVMPLIVLVAKVEGLYDRDELVIRKSTLDELPRLLNLATLSALLVWLARHFVVIGAPGTETLLLLWVSLIASITVGRGAARRLASLITPCERCFLTWIHRVNGGSERFRRSGDRLGGCSAWWWWRVTVSGCRWVSGVRVLVVVGQG
jgi:hypothetical protein